MITRAVKIYFIIVWPYCVAAFISMAIPAETTVSLAHVQFTLVVLTFHSASVWVPFVSPLFDNSVNPDPLVISRINPIATLLEDPRAASVIAKLVVAPEAVPAPTD